MTEYLHHDDPMHYHGFTIKSDKPINAYWVAQSNHPIEDKQVDVVTVPQDVIKQVAEALGHTRSFIRNDTELGFIRMPDHGLPDTAHDCLPNVEQALVALKPYLKGGT